MRNAEKRLSLATGILAGLLLMVALLYAAIASVALRAERYPDAAPYGEMARELVAYLSGRQDALSERLFTERERLHMADVLGLFAFGRRLTLGCCLLSLPLLLLAGFKGSRPALANGLRAGMGAFAAASLLLAAWALLDFSGWFTAMHKLVFTNDLWLLDPADSALIRMLPLDFFVGAVRSVALRLAVGAACLLLGTALVKKRV